MYLLNVSRAEQNHLKMDPNRQIDQNRAEPNRRYLVQFLVLYHYFGFTRFSSGQNTFIRFEIAKPT